MCIIEYITFLAQLYASGYTENGNKEKAFEAVSNRSISFDPP